MAKDKSDKSRSPKQRPLPQVGKLDKKPRELPKIGKDVTDALKVADEIVSAIEEVAEWKVLKNQDYFESTEEKAKAIAETIGRTQHVTEGQRAALDNMLAGVLKWVD